MLDCLAAHVHLHILLSCRQQTACGPSLLIRSKCETSRRHLQGDYAAVVVVVLGLVASRRGEGEHILEAIRFERNHEYTHRPTEGSSQSCLCLPRLHKTRSTNPCSPSAAFRHRSPRSVASKRRPRQGHQGADITFLSDPFRAGGPSKPVGLSEQVEPFQRQSS